MQATEAVIHVFSWSLEVPDVVAVSLATQLSDEERTRARRLVKPKDSSHFVAARAGLRLLVSKATGLSPGDILFEYSPFGKPFLPDDGSLQFNLSHSDGVAVLALSRCGPVGIDLQRVRAMTSGIEEQFLTSGEILRLRDYAPAVRERALVDLWAAKEAIIKLYGCSRQLRPKEIELSVDDPTLASKPENCSGCRIVRLEVEPGYACVIASESSVSTDHIELTAWTGLMPAGA